MKDAVWFVRPGPNEGLRYSLRSAHAHAGVENVWIVGDPPDWYTGPRIKGNPFGGIENKWRNVFANVSIIATTPGLPAEVAVWNDDFFAMEPVKVEMAWREPLADHVSGLNQSPWRDSLVVAWDHLQDKGIREPLSYELHRPFPIVRATMAEILADAADVYPMTPPQWRTLYGNLANAGGYQDVDGKVYATNPDKRTGPWVSTNDGSWQALADVMSAHFPDPSPWERA